MAVGLFCKPTWNKINRNTGKPADGVADESSADVGQDGGADGKDLGGEDGDPDGGGEDKEPSSRGEGTEDEEV